MPGVPSADSTDVDVEILETDSTLLGKPFAGRKVLPDEWPICSLLEDGSVYLNWPDLSEIVVSADGRKITTHIFASIPRIAFLSYPLTQALSFALLKSGIEPLHATTVKVGDSAIAIMGDCGYGKSTLAAAFVGQGHRLLGDDLLVTEVAGDDVFVRPGAARLKLFPGVAETLLGSTLGGVQLVPVTCKLVINFQSSTNTAERVPLRAIYVLTSPAECGAKDPITIRPLPGRDACLQLLKNTYNDMITGEERLASQFTHVTDLTTYAPVKCLHYPRSPDKLNDVYEAILEDQGISK